MNKLLILIISIPIITNSQINPINFEVNGAGSNWTWTTFENDDNPTLEIVNNINSNGINSSSLVAKFTARVMGQPWSGCESLHGFDIGSFSLDSSNCIVKIMVYKSKISDVGIKFVDPTSAALPEIKITNSLTNEWEELTFNFCSRIGVFPVIKDQIVIFPDFDLNGRTDDVVVFFDNINFSSPSNTSSWDCVNNECVEFFNSSGNFVDSISCASQCYQSTTNNINSKNNSVYQVFNKLGVPIKHIQNNQIYFYMHKNGTVEKKLIIK